MFRAVSGESHGSMRVDWLPRIYMGARRFWHMRESGAECSGGLYVWGCKRKLLRRYIMKKIVEIDTKEGLESLLGQKVLLLCANYFYTGRLVGVNRTCVLLDEAAIVYETGRWDA